VEDVVLVATVFAVDDEIDGIVVDLFTGGDSFRDRDMVEGSSLLGDKLFGKLPDFKFNRFRYALDNPQHGALLSVF